MIQDAVHKIDVTESTLYKGISTMSFLTIEFAPKFSKVHREIEAINTKVYAQEGFWFLRSHTYSIDELLESKHHSRIDSITGKIADDVKNWHENGKFTFIDEMKYKMSRDEIETKLNELNQSICNRQPTWWEKVKKPFEEFVHFIIENMPIPHRNLLTKLSSNLLGYTTKNIVKMIGDLQKKHVK